jgi:NitT/TauT family transport system substrate-binding protein
MCQYPKSSGISRASGTTLKVFCSQSLALFVLSCTLWLPQAGAARDLNLGVVNWIGYGPIYVAAANGYYRKYGPDVHLVTFSDNSLMPGALQGSELDASALTYDQVIVADSRGLAQRVVMPIDYSVGGDAIVGSNAVRSLHDLKGHNVAYQPGTTSEFLLGYALNSVGLSERDIRSVTSTPEGVPAMLASHAVDVGVTYEPNVSTVLNLEGGRRFHALLTSREARGMITDVLAVTEASIAHNPKMVEGLMRGTLDGLGFMRSNPQQAAAIIARVLEISPAEVTRQLALIENPDLAHLGDVFQKSDSLPSFYASGKIIGDMLLKSGQVKQLAPIDSTLDIRFVHALQAGH